MEQDPPLLVFDAVSKRFGGTLAVDSVTLAVRAGEILALLGENGAGKSTLIKMLAGIHAPDGGEIRLAGAPYRHLAANRRATARGQRVAFIHQDLGLIDWMTVAENVSLGVGYRRRRGLISWSASRAQAEAALARAGADIDPDARVMHLSRTDRSLVAIARALAAQAELLVLDEPTASLPADEVARLIGRLRELRGQGLGMIYVSHRLDEVFEVADRVAVLRDGRLVDCLPVADCTPAGLVGMIVGRPHEQVFAGPLPPRQEIRLSLAGLVAAGAGPLDLTLRAGEMVGLVGLRGAGQDAVGRAIFGALPLEAGRIELDGRPFRPTGPAEAIAAGVGLVAGERVAEGLGMALSVRENLFLNPRASGYAPLSLISPRRETQACRAAGARMSLRPNDPQRPVETLSGGNQQKVVLARWLPIARRLLILEEPTAGVDVGAKAEIYALLRAATAEGLAVLVVATDFEEVASLCHRAIVFSQGRPVAELSGEALSVASILQAASVDVAHGAADPRSAAQEMRSP